MTLRKEDAAAEGFSLVDLELAHLLTKWAPRPQGGVALAAALASRQRRAGHPCLLLEEWAGREHGLLGRESAHGALSMPGTCPNLEDWLAELRESGVVAHEGNGGAPQPLVLEAGRLYLQRMHAAEGRVAQALLFRMRPLEPPAGLAELLERVAPQDGDPLQRQAVEAVFQRAFHVLTGGPGTGKTSTVGRMLAVALALEPGLRIRLAAPTGKAAARLQEALGESLGWLPQELRQALSTLPRASTLHRLLHEAPPLDWLVVDEASMVDLGLMDRVLAFLPPHARLLLVGDADQLASVDAGAVLHHVVEGLVGRRVDEGGAPTPMVTTLMASRRFGQDSAIGRLALAVRTGDGEAAMAALRGGGEVEWIQRGDARSGVAFSAALRKGLGPFVKAVTAAEALAALDTFRTICGRRSGPQGVEAVNSWCRRQFQESGVGSFSPVLIRVNDHVLGLANGDSGVREHAPGTGKFHFHTGDTQALSLDEAQVPPHDEAWAITVHQSQGSEADELLLVLPEEASPLLCRELLYTGLTRARKKLVLVASEAALRQALGNVTRRSSGLAGKLQVASAPAEGEC
jgi:exodeoxyribonuclease V alpha subunit